MVLLGGSEKAEFIWGGESSPMISDASQRCEDDDNCTYDLLTTGGGPCAHPRMETGVLCASSCYDRSTGPPVCNMDGKCVGLDSSCRATCSSYELDLTVGAAECAPLKRATGTQAKAACVAFTCTYITNSGGGDTCQSQLSNSPQRRDSCMESFHIPPNSLVNAPHGQCLYRSRCAMVAAIPRTHGANVRGAVRLGARTTNDLGVPDVAIPEEMTDATVHHIGWAYQQLALHLTTDVEA